MKKLSSMVLASAILGGTTLFGAGIATLESVKGTPASLDASDAAWAKAKEISVPLTETPYKPDGYKGMLKSTAVIKSLYDDKNIYIKLQYDDPTYSIDRQPWVKQEDGSWKQLKVLDQAGQDNIRTMKTKRHFFGISTPKALRKKGVLSPVTLPKMAKIMVLMIPLRVENIPTIQVKLSICGTGKG